MAHPEGSPLVFNRGGVLKARKDGHLTEEQTAALLDELSRLEPGATLTQEEANEVVAGGIVDRRNFFQKQFGGILSNDPRDKGTFTKSTFDIPLPFTDETIGVNAPTGLIGLTLASLGLSAPAGGVLGSSIPLTGSRAIIPGLNALRGTTAASRFGGLTGATARTLAPAPAAVIGGGIIGDALTPAPDFTLSDVVEEEASPSGGALGQEIAGRPGPKLPTAGGDPEGPIERNPVIDSTTGEPIPGQFFYTQDGQVIANPNDVRFTPEQKEQQFAFLQTKEGAEFAATSRAEAAALKFQQDQQLAAFDRQRENAIRQGNLEEAREITRLQREFLADQSRRQRDASFVNALLPILASPGSRFRFAANVSRLAGGQAQFTPTEAFGRLFRFSGLQPGQAVPLTGEQNFSIIPNIQQFADFGPRERDELEAIIGESSGRSLFGIGRQSKRLAPPR